jgi:hypothetical protein
MNFYCSTLNGTKYCWPVEIIRTGGDYTHVRGLAGRFKGRTFSTVPSEISSYVPKGYKLAPGAKAFLPKRSSEYVKASKLHTQTYKLLSSTYGLSSNAVPTPVAAVLLKQAEALAATLRPRTPSDRAWEYYDKDVQEAKSEIESQRGAYAVGKVHKMLELIEGAASRESQGAAGRDPGQTPEPTVCTVVVPAVVPADAPNPRTLETFTSEVYALLQTKGVTSKPKPLWAHVIKDAWQAGKAPCWAADHIAGTLSGSRVPKLTHKQHKYNVYGVLAGAYRGKDIGKRTLLTHAVAINEAGRCVGEKTLCRSIDLDSMCTDPGTQYSEPPTCTKCKLRLGKSAERVKSSRGVSSAGDPSLDEPFRGFAFVFKRVPSERAESPMDRRGGSPYSKALRAASKIANTTGRTVYVDHHKNAWIIWEHRGEGQYSKAEEKKLVDLRAISRSRSVKVEPTSKPMSKRDPNQKEYENREVSSFLKQMREVEKLPLADRKEGAASFALAMANDPALVAERVGWLLDGSYGYGSYIKASEVAKSPRMNRAAWLVSTVGALEWQSPPRLTQAAWKKLTAAQKAALDKFVQSEIRTAIESDTLHEGSKPHNVPSRGGHTLHDPEKYKLPRHTDRPHRLGTGYIGRTTGKELHTASAESWREQGQRLIDAVKAAYPTLKKLPKAAKEDLKRGKEFLRRAVLHEKRGSSKTVERASRRQLEAELWKTWPKEWRVLGRGKRAIRMKTKTGYESQEISSMTDEEIMHLLHPARRDPAYLRKTEDVWTLQGRYGHGWEDLTAESSRAEIKQRLKEYRENEGGEYRIVKKREKRVSAPVTRDPAKAHHFVIVTRLNDPKYGGQGLPWTTMYWSMVQAEGKRGEMHFKTKAEAEEVIREVRSYGPDWAAAEYRALGAGEWALEKRSKHRRDPAKYVNRPSKNGRDPSVKVRREIGVIGNAMWHLPYNQVIYWNGPGARLLHGYKNGHLSPLANHFSGYNTLKDAQAAVTRFVNSLSEDRDPSHRLVNRPSSRGRDPMPTCPVGTEIQSLILDQSHFDTRDAAGWVKRHGFHATKVDRTAHSFRFRQKDPSSFRHDSFRIITMRPGVKAVIACPLHGG